MNILYHVPHTNTIYAGRVIYNGYKNAWTDLGHNFKFFTAEDIQEEIFDTFEPHILITSLNFYNLKYLDLDILKKYKNKGLKVFVNTPFWKSPMSITRVNEASSLSSNLSYINLIKSGNYGDAYYNACESEDARMLGFESSTGYKHHTIPLAADKTIHFPEFSKKFECEISFLGTYLPEKRQFIKEYVYPLKKNYDLRLYGQDWTLTDRLIGFTHKVGQYFNLPLIKSLQKPKLHLEDERRIYNSSKISLNIHEDYQKQYGGDCNERTFKIPICGGFEISDDVACIRKYFKEGKEIIIAKDKQDWFDKINYYISRPEERNKIIEAGRARVLSDHTYHNRVEKFLEIYKSL